MTTSATILLIGSLIVTSYRSVKNQTDNTPFYTSTGEHVSSSGVAISQDMLCNTCLKLHKRCKHPNNDRLHYGDFILIEDIGIKRINDVMNKRYKKRFDVWVSSLKEEHEFWKRYKNIKLRVYRIKE